jgi:secreted trypsin-like serine protease
MKRRIVATVLAIFLAVNPYPLNAVEGGDDAAGSQFVVPIKIEQTSSRTTSCSGALISPYIVVTAGHCALDASGLVAKNIYVGQAGSSMESITKGDLIDSVKITSSFQNSTTNVDDDDLAFLVLKKPQLMPTQVSLASESEMTALKNAGGQLRLFGYGRYGDTSEETITFPKSYSGTFSQFTTSVPNSGYLESTKDNACQGDSGGPVLSITATKVTIVGIVTGGTLSKYCTKPLASNGKYYALFTVIGRYSNLAFASASQSISALSEGYEKTKSDLEAANELVEDLEYNLTDANDRVEELLASVESYKKSTSALTVKLKKICSAKPKPKGC